MCAELGATDEARRLLDEVAANDYATLPRDAIWVGAIAYLTEVATRLGDPRHAERLYHLLLPYGDRNVVVGWASSCLGSAARLLGMLAALLSRPAAAAAHFEQALAMNRAMGATPWVVRTLLPYAALLLTSEQADEQSRGRRYLDEGLETAAQLGMATCARQLPLRQRLTSARLNACRPG